MYTKKTYIYIALIFLLSIFWLFLGSRNETGNAPETIKIALRDVGHHILLTNSDSLSLVLPVKQLDDSRYRLKFESEISIQPDSLVTIIKERFKKSNLSERYIVEVIQCSDNEVAYSYKMRKEEEKNIVPCRTRALPFGCYTIESQFLNIKKGVFGRSVVLLVIILLALYVILDIVKNKKSLLNPNIESSSPEKITLGNYIFYPNQSKLALKRKEIQLSKKEGDLLSILVENLNQVVKREDLTKKVWEDNGVVVGRSLDTYISKLRKRFQEDSTIKLSNIHGVGYKLEIG